MKQFNNKKNRRRKKNRKKRINFLFCFITSLLLLSPLFIPWRLLLSYTDNKTYLLKASIPYIDNLDVDISNLSTSYLGLSTETIHTEYEYIKPEYSEPIAIFDNSENINYTTNSIDSSLYAYFDVSNISQDELNYFTKLVHSEFCGGGHEGRCAVANVVVNRIVDGRMGNSIYSVIQRPGQFQPYAQGKLNTNDICDECYNAVIDVLYNNYRVFPIYVLYFQSHRDGYFSDHITYLSMQSLYGNVYFSYKQSDKDMYENSTFLN